ncbi:hypothetical protein F4781DRAFT_427026 [Annulohypoxylon bovei var. microspora]|nr:hypothetical protein F4781DRAFT_427026 [Annulohypoxylon bovei var. microspora]
MSRHKNLILTALASSLIAPALAIPDPIICEDTLDGSPPFNSNDVPCLLGCGAPLAVATGSLLPGSVNETDIPYCQLNCVHEDATPAQSSAAPGCYDRCHVLNQATPENIGWCMFWCVEGFTDLVTSTACVPSLEYDTLVTTTIGGVVVIERPFTEPPEWASWYLTQTVISRTGVVTASPGLSVTVAPSSTAAFTAPFRVSSASGSEPVQETQTSGSTADAESAVDTTTEGQSAVPATTEEQDVAPTSAEEQSVVSSTAAEAEGCVVGESLLGVLGVVGVLVMLL